MAELSKSFINMMEKGNVNGALKLLMNNISNEILPLHDNKLQLLHEKHPASKNADDEVLRSRGKPRAHPVMYESIDEDLMKERRFRVLRSGR